MMPRVDVSGGGLGGGANIIVSMAGGDSFRRVIALSEFMAGSI